MARAAAREPLPETLEEFVAWHEQQPERWEFIGGEPIMMSPPSRRHTMIKGNIYRHIMSKLEGRDCTAYVDGLELRAFDISAIPDIIVACGPPDMASPVEQAPVVIVEVGSPSTYDRDLSWKLDAYRQFPSLRHYLVVHHAKRSVVLIDRESSDELRQVWHRQGVIPLPGLGIDLSMDEIFDGVPDEPVAEGKGSRA